MKQLFLAVMLAFGGFQLLAGTSTSLDTLKDVGFDFNFALNSVKFMGTTDQFAPNYSKSIDKVIDMMIKKPNLKVKVAAHVDKSLIVTKKVTNDLTQKRANAVRKYMISKGIAAARILAVGVNGTQPLDTLKKNFEKNNRVEASFQKPAVDQGYSKPAVLENVKFISSSDTMFSSSNPAIDRVIKVLLANPTIEIKIYGHVFAPGAVDYNLKLSNNRAISVRNYMISKKVAAERITAVGYGDQFPITSDETDVGRDLNNRIEIAFKKQKGK